MAIYSCNLSSVGRTTHRAGTAGAHLRYISRPDARPIVEAHAIPQDAAQARTWMDHAEAADRKNARVMDKVRVAIPRELTDAQRVELVRAFCQGVTGDRVPWMFAIHQTGKDAGNPHAHIVIRDRDLETGKRVLRLSDSARDREKAGLEPKAVEWIRERWEHHANQALERAGHDARIDRRSLEAQGIDRAPTIHIGPRAAHIDGQVHRPQSKVVRTATGREIDYPMIDAGRTRKERQAEIVDLNLERAARSPDFETREWAKFEKAQRDVDRVLDAELTAQARRHTLEERRARTRFREQAAALRLERLAEHGARSAELRASFASRADALKSRHQAERDQLAKQQGGLWNRLVETIDITGTTRRKHAAERAALDAEQKAARRQIGQDARVSRQTLSEALQGRYGPRRDALQAERRLVISRLAEREQRIAASADAKRQLREADRERGRVHTGEAIQAMKRIARKPDPAPAPDLGNRSQMGFNDAAQRERAERIRQEIEKQRRAGPRGPTLGR